MQPDSFMKKYYATSSEWDIFEFFAETMQHRRGYGAGGGGRNRDPYMAQQPQPGQHQYQQSPRQIKVTESTESSNRERTQSTKADYASIW